MDVNSSLGVLFLLPYVSNGVTKTPKFPACVAALCLSLTLALALALSPLVSLSSIRITHLCPPPQVESVTTPTGPKAARQG